MKPLLIISICLLAAPVHASDWTWTDTALQTVFLTTLAVDRGQSVYQNERPEVGFAKTFIGSHPTDRQINTYFLSVALGHTAMAYLLPTPWRTIWQSVFIGIEIGTIRANMNAGLTVRF